MNSGIDHPKMCKPRHLIGIIVLAASAAHGQTLTGRVVGVSDGDTITVLVTGIA